MLETIFTILMVMFWYVCGIASALLFIIIYGYEDYKQRGFIDIDNGQLLSILLSGVFGPVVGLLMISTLIIAAIMIFVIEFVLKVKSFTEFLNKIIVIIKINKETANLTRMPLNNKGI